MYCFRKAEIRPQVAPRSAPPVQQTKTASLQSNHSFDESVVRNKVRENGSDLLVESFKIRADTRSPPAQNAPNMLGNMSPNMNKPQTPSKSPTPSRFFRPRSRSAANDSNDSEIAFNSAIRSLVKLSTAFIKKQEYSKNVGLDGPQIRRMKEAFRMFDKNADGHITAKEICEVMNGVGIDIQLQEAKNLIRNIDRNGNGKVELREFIKFLSMKSTSDSEDNELAMAFALFDRNKDGRISLTEMQAVLERLGESFTQDELKELFSDVDTDGSGEIDFEEFKVALKIA